MVFAMTPAERRRAIVERVLRDRLPDVAPEFGREVLTDGDLDRLWLDAGAPDGWSVDHVDTVDRLSDDEFRDLWNFAGCPETFDVEDALWAAEQAWDAYSEAFDRLENYLRARARAAFLGTADVKEAMARLAAI